MLGNDHNLMDLKQFDIVLIPVIDKNHYYVICFDFKNSSISLIDNMHEKFGMVTLKNHEEYLKKDTPLKVVRVLVV
jgi:hypothetical protein